MSKNLKEKIHALQVITGKIEADIYKKQLIVAIFIVINWLYLINKYSEV